MSVGDIQLMAGKWGPSAATAFMVFVALWFDPRIGYIQRDIADNRSYIAQVDKDGTRKSQSEFEGIMHTSTDNTRRIQALEDKYEHIDAALSAILQRLASEKK